MKLITKLCYFLFFISGLSFASCSIGDGNYVFCSSNEKNILMLPDFASGGGINAYFYSAQAQLCQNSSTVDMVSSLYINNILVQFSRGCSSGYISTFPATRRGANYVLNEFLTKVNVVILNSNREYIATFNATGFKQGLDNFIKTNGGSGGGL